MNEIVSVVVVKNKHGYIASLRYKDPVDDEDLAATSHWSIMEQIDSAVIYHTPHHY